MITMTLARTYEIADRLGMTTEQLEDIRHTKESPEWLMHDGEVLYVVECIERRVVRSPKKLPPSSANDLTRYFEAAEPGAA